LRSYAISKLDLRREGMKAVAEPILAGLAKNDPKRTVRASAISKLGDYRKAVYAPLFRSSLSDSSYSVAGSALEALGKTDSVAAFTEAKRLSSGKTKGKLAGAVTSSMIEYGDESAADIVLGNFESMPLSQAKFEALQPLSQFLAKVNSFETFKRGVDDIEALHNDIPESFRAQVTGFIDNLYKTLQKKKSDAGHKQLADYAASKLSKEKKGI
jgi:aminopeptidase N